MSLLFVDGFDHYDDIRLKWVAPSVMEDPDFVDGRTGGQALQKQFQNGSGIRKSLTKQAEVVIGLAIYTGDDGLSYQRIPFDADEATEVRVKSFPADDLITFKDSADVTIMTLKFIQLGLPTSGSGRLEIEYPGPTLNIIVDSFQTWSTEQWEYIQVKYHPNKTGGLIEVVDGTGSLLFQATGRTTEEDDNDIEVIQLMGTATNSARYRIDDLYILNTLGADNNDYLGDVRVTPFVLRSTLAAQSTAAPAPHHSALNETVMDTNTKVTMGEIGILDNYEVEGFICHGYTPIGTIKGIQYNIAAAKDNAGIIKYQHRVNSTDSGVDVVAQTFTGIGDSSGFGIDSRVYDTDPADSLDWTEAKIEAIEVGFKLTVREGGA